jgi:error-prone DNA polymerase
MGFYAPAQIVGDARKNGVEVREIDVSFSHAQNTLEEQSGDYCAVRLGFRQIDGFKWADPDEEGLKRSLLSFRGTRSVNPESRDSGSAPGGASRNDGSNLETPSPLLPMP